MRRAPIVQPPNCSRGFSLVELMVALTLSAIVLVGVTASFSTTLSTNATSLAQARLTEEVRAVMEVMTREIRRAGYWGNAGAAAQNPFSPTDSGLIDPGAGNTCIRFAYDADSSGDAALANAERYGFRLNNGVIEWARTNATNCNAGAWTPMTTGDTNVTAFNVTVYQPTCVNVSDSPRSDCNPCAGGYTAWAAGDTLVRVWNVQLSITAQTTRMNLGGSTPRVTLTDSVRIANEDLVLNGPGGAPAAGTGPCI